MSKLSIALLILGALAGAVWEVIKLIYVPVLVRRMTA